MHKILKYRGIILDTRRWIFGYGCIYDKEKNISHIVHKDENNISVHTEVYPETLSEYVCMKDVNGIELYANDFVIREGEPFGKEGTSFTVGLICWDRNSWRVSYSSPNAGYYGRSGSEILNTGGHEQNHKSHIWTKVGDFFNNVDLITEFEKTWRRFKLPEFDIAEFLEEFTETYEK